MSKSIREKIVIALRNLKTVRGQLDLGRQVLGTQYTLDHWAEFNEALRSMLADPAEVVETKIDYGHYHEYEYSLPVKIKSTK
jgi:hypothetical protein